MNERWISFVCRLEMSQPYHWNDIVNRPDCVVQFLGLETSNPTNKDTRGKSSASSEKYVVSHIATPPIAAVRMALADAVTARGM